MTTRSEEGRLKMVNALLEEKADRITALEAQLEQARKERDGEQRRAKWLQAVVNEGERTERELKVENRDALRLVGEYREALRRGAEEGESEVVRSWCRLTLAALSETPPPAEGAKT